MTTITPEGPVPKRRRIALIAHDHKKDDMIAFGNALAAEDISADVDGNGVVDDKGDVEAFVNAFCVAALKSNERSIIPSGKLRNTTAPGQLGSVSGSGHSFV